MAFGTLSPDLKISKQQRPRAGAGGRPPLDHPRGGYGGGGGPGGNGGPDYSERLHRYRFGLAIALVSIVTLFVCISAAFIFRQGYSTYDPATGTYIRDWQPMHLPVHLLWANTLLLLLSSISLELARRQAIKQSAWAPAFNIPGIVNDHRPFPWLPLTIFLGSAFLAGQAVAWKVVDSALLSSGTSTSFYYILTGTHAVHVLGGIVALCYALSLAWMEKPHQQRRIVIDVTSWYWHVIGTLWLFLFALLSFSR